MRRLTNGLVAGQFTAVLLTELVFMLNPEVPHTVANVLAVLAVLSATYGLAIGAAACALLILVEALRGEPLRPAWLSFRLSTWLFALGLTAAAFLLWYNLIGLRLYLPEETLHLVRLAATVVSTAAGAFLFMALFQYSFGRRGAVMTYFLSAVLLLAAVTLPLATRPRPEPEPAIPRMPIQDAPLARRVTLIGIEGASMSYVLRAVAEGKLPNFARLIESGASGPLRTIDPTESLAVWTSIATGKLPSEHGIKGFYRYRFPGVEASFTLRPRGLDFGTLDRLGLVQRSAVTATLRRSQPFWTILTSFGVRVGIVRYWGSYPADPVDGFVVSEYFHRQVRERFDPPLPHLTFPEDLFSRLSPEVVFPDAIDAETLNRFVDTSVAIDSDRFPWREKLTRALADDMTYQRVGTVLRKEKDPEVFAIYFFGLDVIGHYFTRYAEPERFGDVSDAEIRKYGRVVEGYYRYLDGLLGEYLSNRAPNETIIVLSGHGMEPLPLARRIVERFKGNLYLSGYHEDAPDGLLILGGAGIAPGTKLQGASILDITPTVLYLMGLPLGQDMDGFLLTDVLLDEVKRNQPVTLISSYRNFLIEPRRSDDGREEGSPLDALPEILEIPD